MILLIEISKNFKISHYINMTTHIQEFILHGASMFIETNWSSQATSASGIGSSSGETKNEKRYSTPAFIKAISRFS